MTPPAIAYYTRAGDFITDNEGYLRNPQGYSVSGYRYDSQGNLSNTVEPIQMSAFEVLTAKPTSQIEWQFNLGFDTDNCVSETDPYFALQQSYNATTNPPISNTGASYQMPITLYDAEGNPVEVTAYFGPRAFRPQRDHRGIRAGQLHRGGTDAGRHR